MLFGKALQNGALGLFRRGDGNTIMSVGSVEHPRDHAVIPLVDRARRSLATHRAIDGFNGQFAGVGRRVCLPTADLSLARLPGGEADVHGLLDGLVNNFGGEIQQRSDASSLGRTEMRNMVEILFMARARFNS